MQWIDLPVEDEVLDQGGDHLRLSGPRSREDDLPPIRIYRHGSRLGIIKDALRHRLVQRYSKALKASRSPY
jgi:hypothetical protein